MDYIDKYRYAFVTMSWAVAGFIFLLNKVSLKPAAAQSSAQGEMLQLNLSNDCNYGVAKQS
ncbi:hypothetical protein N5D77_11205 [Comamonas thiooxydans]|uniref:Uncharacterized protein n=1 Tax=Comamonas thiooxydans TaxID=363952 RepID=A0AA42TU85_9BURK|nr:hypothetical protein [Comamonas thiooxydans]MDH1334609.1 hypothetical protein [Comamonas thiooxydans]MDH1740946.1 hypothetical protein [Comamonas thiooxydans]MDH1787139.1 hypothetical protein [Comamonas thiooxydans]